MKNSSRPKLALTFLFIGFTHLLFAQKIKNLDERSKQATIASLNNETKEFLSIPNFAGDLEGINQNIKWLKTAFEKRAFEVQTLDTEGNSLVFAERKAKRAKETVLFYMHFDGQNVDTTKWFQPNPYEPVIKKKTQDQWKIIDWSNVEKDFDPEWRVFARSASDDKGPILMMLAALDMINDQKVKIPYNIKVILDSEEESGSPNLTKAVKKYAELLAADHMVIADGPMHDSGLPTLVHGCRGIAKISLELYGPRAPQHSGHFGNYAPNPAQRMAELLATMKDDNGKVIVPGYYDQINLSDDIKNILQSVPDDEERIQKRVGIGKAEGVGANYQEAIQYPSLNVRGFTAGWTGTQTRTIVPDKAVVEIDIRTVPETKGDDLIQLVRNHIDAQGYTILDNRMPTEEERLTIDKLISFDGSNEMNPFFTPMDSPTGNWLMNALTATYDQEIVRMRLLGGSVPIAQFVEELNVPAMLVPMVNPDNNQHSPNENLRLGHFQNGIKTFVGILTTPVN